MNKFDVYKEIIDCFKYKDYAHTYNAFKCMIRKYLKFHNIPSCSISRIVTNYEENFNYVIDDRILTFDHHVVVEDGSDTVHNAILIEKLTGVLHELSHVETLYFKNILFNSEFLNRQYNNSYDTIFDDMCYYNDYHDFFIFEYYADLRSYIIFEDIYLNYLKDYIDDDTITDYNSFIASLLYECYSNIDLTKDERSYPLLNNKIVCNINDDNFFDSINELLNSNLSNLDKLKRGLPISDELLKYINNVACEKIKTKTLFEDIKKAYN